MAGRRRAGPGEAYRLLKEYQARNQDLSRHQLDALGPFAIAHRVSKEALVSIWPDIGPAPYIHRSWFWYNGMKLSGMGHHWDQFVEERNSYELRRALFLLRDLAHPREWSLLSARLGHYQDIKPENYNARNRGYIWTKGGCWSQKSGIGKITVLGGHLGQRPHYSCWTSRLTNDQLLQLETEVHNTIDQDKLLEPDAKHAAVAYVRRRIPELLGYNVSTVGYYTASWFFQQRIQDPSFRIYFWERSRVPCPRSSSATQWRW